MVPTRNTPTDSLVDLLADLVAFPTESRTSNLELIDLYADRAVAAGAVAFALLASGRISVPWLVVIGAALGLPRVMVF